MCGIWQVQRGNEMYRAGVVWCKTQRSVWHAGAGMAWSQQNTVTQSSSFINNITVINNTGNKINDRHRTTIGNTVNENAYLYLIVLT